MFDLADQYNTIQYLDETPHLDDIHYDLEPNCVNETQHLECF